MGTPQGCRGPWGGETSPSTRSLGGRKWRRRVDHSFPPHLSAWPAPPPAGLQGRGGPRHWPGRTPSLLDPRGYSLSLERAGGSVPLSAWPPLGLWFWEFAFPFSFLSLFNIRLQTEYRKK